jgi:hypothetical protein
MPTGEGHRIVLEGGEGHGKAGKKNKIRKKRRKRKKKQLLLQMPTRLKKVKK